MMAAGDRLRLTVTLLGVPALATPEGPLDLRERKALALIAHLALSPGPVARSMLAALLWPDAEKERAGANLRHALFSAQRAGLGPWLRTDQASLCLVGAVEVDALTFQTACSEGRWADAVELYTGDFLAGFALREAAPFEGWQAEQAEALRSRFLAALAGAVEAARGRDDRPAALALARRWVATDALNESAQLALIELLGQGGQLGAARAAFDTYARLLEEELGLSPGQAVMKLIEDLSEPSRPEEVEPRPPLPPMVGRAEVLARLRGSGALLCLIVGESGLGKTRLARALTEGGRDLWLHFPEAASRTPLSAVAGALRERRDLARLRSLGPAVWREVTRLLPDLDPSQTAEAEPTQPVEGRVRFLEGLAQALSTLAGQGGTIVLDDLHWADPTSLELLHHLIRRLRRERSARVVATAWPDELGARPELRALLSDLEREGQLERIPLNPLGPQEVQALAQQNGVKQVPTHLHADTGGNPFFVLEALRAWQEAGTAVSPSVREAVLGRVDRLGPEVRRVLEAACLAGNGFRLPEIVPATRLDEWTALEALERAGGAGLLTSGAAGHSFAHDLVRQALAAQLSPERVRLIHHALADALLARRQGGAARIAHHLLLAERGPASVPWRLRAAQEAEAIYAYPEARQQAQAALDTGAHGTEAFEAHALSERLCATLGDTEAREAALDGMAGLAAALGESFELRTQLTRLTFLNDLHRRAEALALADHLLAGSGQLSAEERARVLIGRGRALLYLSRLSDAENDLQAVLDERAGLPLALVAEAHTCLYTCARMRGDWASARAQVQRSLDAYRALGDASGELEALISAGQFAILVGDLAAATGTLELAAQRARDLGHGGHLLWALVTVPWAWIRLGDMPKAEAATRQAEALNAGVRNPRVGCTLVLYRALIARHLGDLGASLRYLEEALTLTASDDQTQSAMIAQLGLIQLHLDVGAVEAARERLHHARRQAEAEPLHTYRLPLELNLARSDLALGHPAQAQACIEAARPLLDAADADDRADFAMAHAEVCLRLGSPEAALALDTSENALPRPRAEAMRLHLEAGDRSQALQSEAQALVASERVPSVEALKLLRALYQAEQTPALKADMEGRGGTLLSSLAAYPALQRSFKWTIQVHPLPHSIDPTEPVTDYRNPQ